MQGHEESEPSLESSQHIFHAKGKNKPRESPSTKAKENISLVKLLHNLKVLIHLPLLRIWHQPEIFPFNILPAFKRHNQRTQSLPCNLPTIKQCHLPFHFMGTRFRVPKMETSLRQHNLLHTAHLQGKRQSSYFKTPQAMDKMDILKPRLKCKEADR